MERLQRSERGRSFCLVILGRERGQSWGWAAGGDILEKENQRERGGVFAGSFQREEGVERFQRCEKKRGAEKVRKAVRKKKHRA